MSNPKCALIARIRPKPDATDRLLAIRDQLIDEFATGFEGFVSAALYRVADSDQWLDVVVFIDRAAAEAVAADPTPLDTASYKEWNSLTEFVDFEMVELLTHHEK